MEHAVEEVAAALTFEPALNQAIRRIGELARECGDKARELDKLRHEVASLRNKHIKPYRTCSLHEVEHGDASVVLEYEYQAAEAEGEFFVGSAASADLIRVWIGGQPFSYELFADHIVEQWEAACLSKETGE